MSEGWCAKHEAIKAAVGCAWCLKAEVERLRAKIEEVLALCEKFNSAGMHLVVEALTGGREK